MITNKKKYILLAVLLSLISMYIINRVHYIHRISDDKTCEFLYLHSDIAIKRYTSSNVVIVGSCKAPKLMKVKLDSYTLGTAHYQGAPEYKFQTGDIMDTIILNKIRMINYEKNIIYGTFKKKNNITFFSYNVDKRKLECFDSLNKLKDCLREHSIVYQPIIVSQFIKSLGTSQ